MSERFDCTCEVPNPYPSPHKADTCVRCSGLINPRWTSNDETFSAFLERFRGSFPGGAPAWFDDLARLCAEREREGRELYRHRSLGRDNPEDAMEEVADFVNYMFFDTLKATRDGSDDQTDLALTGAYHAAMAYACGRRLQAKRHGAP